MSTFTQHDVLEGLRRAHANLTTHDYAFSDWHFCTCGHLYAASREHGVPSRDHYRPNISNPTPGTLYWAMLEAVIKANRPKTEVTCPATIVSNMANYAHLRPGGSREGSLGFVANAIAALEVELADPHDRALTA